MKNEIKSSFTPGPWYARHNQIGSMTSSHGCTITNCNATSRGISDVEVEANARLIAAAPELLAALQDLAAAAARIVEDDDKPSMMHMRELNRSRQRAIEIAYTAMGNGGSL